MMMRLANLSQEVDLLKDKTKQNREQAEKAKALSDNATDAASDLKKVCLFSKDIYAFTFSIIITSD